MLLRWGLVYLLACLCLALAGFVVWQHRIIVSGHGDTRSYPALIEDANRKAAEALSRASDLERTIRLLEQQLADAGRERDEAIANAKRAQTASAESLHAAGVAAAEVARLKSELDAEKDAVKAAQLSAAASASQIEAMKAEQRAQAVASPLETGKVEAAVPEAAAGSPAASKSEAKPAAPPPAEKPKRREAVKPAKKKPTPQTGDSFFGN